MLKSELIDNMASEFHQLSVQEVANGVNKLVAIITETLAAHGRIEIRSFGSFAVNYYTPRQALNPKSGERILTEAKYRPHFKAAKELKERINEV